MYEHYTREDLINEKNTLMIKYLKIENKILKDKISKLFDQNLFLSGALADMAEHTKEVIGIDEDGIEVLIKTIKEQSKMQAEHE